ncbi:hypothetical protein CsSME_00032857 [Camellia sinensis var. sinensis]
MVVDNPFELNVKLRPSDGVSLPLPDATLYSQVSCRDLVSRNLFDATALLSKYDRLWKSKTKSKGLMIVKKPFWSK